MEEKEEQSLSSVESAAVKSFPLIWTILIAVLATAIFVGGGMFFWMKYYLAKTNFNLEQNIEEPTLNGELPEAEKPSASVLPDYLPRIVYRAAGTFSEEEKHLLQSNLLDPFLDYYQLDNNPAVAVLIAKTNNGYLIDSVHRLAFLSFLYELKDSEYPVWCAPCYYSDCSDMPEQFKTKYPEIYQKAMTGCSP